MYIILCGVEGSVEGFNDAVRPNNVALGVGYVSVLSSAAGRKTPGSVGVWNRMVVCNIKDSWGGGAIIDLPPMVIICIDLSPSNTTPTGHMVAKVLGGRGKTPVDVV